MMRVRAAYLFAVLAWGLLLPSATSLAPPPRYAFLDATGQPQAETEGAGCVVDRHTGLMWERKRGQGLRAAQHRYLPAPLLRNGLGLAGYPAPQCDAATPGCLATDYVAAVNRAGLCGQRDWRLPSEAELQSLVALDQLGPTPGQGTSQPAIDRHAFPDTAADFYWTGDKHRQHGYLAVWFDATHLSLPSTGLAADRPGRLRLVRGARLAKAPSRGMDQDAYIGLDAQGQALAGPALSATAVCVDEARRPDALRQITLWQPGQPVSAGALRAPGTQCGATGWRLPSAEELQSWLTAGLGRQAAWQSAFGAASQQATYWVQGSNGVQLWDRRNGQQQAVHGDPVIAPIWLAVQDRPGQPRLLPTPEGSRPSAAELAQWRAQYARYRPGSASQPDWPAPELDEFARTGFHDLGLLPPVPFPADNPYSPAKVALGQQLFFDPRLSGNGQISCASCHDPKAGWTDRRELSLGHIGQRGKRNAMTILNTAYVPELFWDGRAKGLEAQALMPVADLLEMHQPTAELPTRLSADPAYRQAFAAAFGDARIDTTRIAQALATFERTLISRPSAFDRFLRGERQALSDDALWGLQLFRSKARCINCHNGALLSDNRFHSNGLHYYGQSLEDLGRYAVTGRPEDAGAFRTPSLRDVVHTGGYMHNGIFALGSPGVISLYDGGMIHALPTGRAKYDPRYPKTSPAFKPLGLSRLEQQALLAFLTAISAEPRQTPASAAELGVAVRQR